MPSSLNISILKIIITIPEENSIISDGKPSDNIDFAMLKAGFVLIMRKVFFFLIKCIERIERLITGERQVANTAPNIPHFVTKINTQSSRTFEKLPTIIPVVASFGFPSFLTKQITILLSMKNGEHISNVLRYIFVMSNTSVSAPSSSVIDRKSVV